jgi:hypothetical protein
MKTETPVVRKKRKVKYSKTPYEFVFSENFTVEEVIAESHHAYVHVPEKHFDLWGNDKEAGYTSKVILKVVPDNKDIPVNTLVFDGTSAVKAGDRITAKIPRCQKYDPTDRDYAARYYKPEENAIELSILSADGKVLRKDRAIGYKLFVNETDDKNSDAYETNEEPIMGEPLKGSESIPSADQ